MESQRNLYSSSALHLRKREIFDSEAFHTNPKRPKRDESGTVIKSISVDRQSAEASMCDLPDECLLEIVKYIPFEDQISIGRVARRFRRISNFIISKKNSLDLGDVVSRKIGSMTPFSLVSILDLCWEYLERLNFQAWYYIGSYPILEVIAQYSFPRLTTLEIKIYCTNGHVDNFIFGHLIQKNPNLKRFMWSVDGGPVFPCGIFPNLESLELLYCNDNTFCSLVDQVPNLKSFRADCYRIKLRCIFDGFLLSTTQMEQLHLSGIEYFRLSTFWNLHSLTYANFDSDFLVDYCFEKIAASFPRLQILDMKYTEAISAIGLSALSSLKELRILRIRHCYIPMDDADNGLRMMAMCRHLEEVDVDISITPATFISFIRSCPELHYFHAKRILETDSSGAVVEILDHFFEIGKRNVEIAIFKSQLEIAIWRSDFVQATLRRLADESVIINF